MASASIVRSGSRQSPLRLCVNGLASAVPLSPERLSPLPAAGIPLASWRGDPNYYTREGYDPDLALPFDCAYAGPYFMALRLNDSAPKAGKVRYPAAFDQLG